MTRTPLALVATLALATAGGCAPQCTCPATSPGGVATIPAPGPAAAPPPVSQPMPAQPMPAQPTPEQPTPSQPTPAQPTPAQPAAAQPAAAPAAGPVRLVNEGPALRRMGSVYPRYLSDAGVRGDVVVGLTLGDDGRVAETAIESATNDRLRDPALTVAQELRFSAPPAAGTTVRVRLRFQPAGSRIDVLP